MATVSIRHLRKRFDADDVVRGIDIEIADGEFLVIVGPSGCGKTSVLRMVAGLEEITSGQVLVDGTPVGEIPRGSLTLGMIFQDPALYPHMSVEQNIGFPLRMAGHHRRTVRREVAAIADLLGLTPVLQRRPSQLSGGQRQRAAMARALIRRPALLLMDEPMSNLDAKLRTELRATLARLRDELGVTTLYVTHDQIEAMALGDRIAIMRAGEIVQLGAPDEIYARPIDAFVATFIGTPAMNLFAGTVTTDDAGLALDLGAAMLPLGATHAPELAGRLGDTIVAGVRPQSFRFTGDGVVVDVVRMHRRAHRFDIDATLQARAVHVTESGIEIGRRPTRLAIELPVDDDLGWELWRPSHLVVDPDDIHLFDPANGSSLCDQPSAARAVGCGVPSSSSASASTTR